MGIDTKRTYESVQVGAYIRRDIGQDKIFRVRRGNGHYGSVAGELYQDKYDYFVPSTIEDPAGDASRTCFANAVAAWQGLSAAVKLALDKEAQKIRYLSGYNLYIRRYMKANYP